MKTILSPKFTMLPYQWEDFVRGIWKYFVAPALLTYSISTMAAFSVDGFQWSDFIPTEIVWGSIFGGMFAQIISFLTKYVPQKEILVPNDTPDPNATIINKEDFQL